MTSETNMEKWKNCAARLAIVHFGDTSFIFLVYFLLQELPIYGLAFKPFHTGKIACGLVLTEIGAREKIGSK